MVALHLLFKLTYNYQCCTITEFLSSSFQNSQFETQQHTTRHKHTRLCFIYFIWDGEDQVQLPTLLKRHDNQTFDIIISTTIVKDLIKE